jgi:hypothetical protein
MAASLASQTTPSPAIRKGADRARLITHADNHRHCGNPAGKQQLARSAAHLLSWLQPVHLVGEGPGTRNHGAYMLRVVVGSPQN